MKNQIIREYLQGKFKGADVEEKSILKNIYEKFSADYEINFSYIEKEVNEYKENGFFPLVSKSDIKSNSDGLFFLGENNYLLDTLIGAKNKFDVIYIDPPYNTGNDGLNYSDSFKHSEWMTDMQVRLIKAKRLMTNDAFIAVSIDDNELISLVALLNAIFGRENKVGIYPRKSKTNDGGSTNSAILNDWLIIFTKNLDTRLNQFDFSNPKDYKEQEKKYPERGNFQAKHTLDSTSLGYQPSLDFKIEIEGKTFVPGGDVDAWKQRQKGNHDKFDPRWTWNKERFEIGYSLGLVEIKGDRLYIKKYEKYKFEHTGENKNKFVKNNKKRPLSSLEFVDSKYTNEVASKEIKKLLKVKKLEFSYPKPTSLIEKVISLSPNKNAKVLDFYAGTGSTAHAVINMNKDGGSRKFVICTNDESNVDKVLIKRLDALDSTYSSASISKTLESGYVDDFGGILKKSIKELNGMMESIGEDGELKWREFYEESII